MTIRFQPCVWPPVSIHHRKTCRLEQCRLALTGEKAVQLVFMINSNTLQNWRPHPLVYFHCGLAIVLFGTACSWGVAQFIAWCCPPQSRVNPVLFGVGVFAVVFWLSLRRCSTPASPAFRGLLLITACMTIGMGSFSLLFVIPAVAFAMVALISVALVSLFRNDAAYAQRHFKDLVQFYRRHRMYQ